MGQEKKNRYSMISIFMILVINSVDYLSECVNFYSFIKLTKVFVVLIILTMTTNMTKANIRKLSENK